MKWTWAFVVVYGLVLGGELGTFVIRDQLPLAGPMPPTCYTVGQYTKTTNPVRFCAPEAEQTY